MMRKSILIFWIAIPAVFLIGCQTNPSVYRDANAEPTVKTTRLQAYDVKRVTDRMIDALLATDHPFKAGTRTVVRWAGISNKTNQHFDTKRITNRIRTKLINSGRVRIVSDDSESAIRKSISNERGLSQSKAASSNTRRKSGRLSASAFKLYGDIQEISSRDSSGKSRAYLTTINLIDVETGELIWAAEEEILKEKSRSTFGM